MTDSNHAGHKRGRRGWGFIAIAAAVLAIAAIIFSSAGPDRSRTAGYKESIPSAVNPGEGGSKERMDPNVNMPTAPTQR